MTEGLDTDQLISSLYKTTIDPEQFDTLVDLWTRQLSSADLDLLSNEQLKLHFDQAEQLLSRWEAVDENKLNAPAPHISSLAMVIDQNCNIVSLNEKAAEFLGPDLRNLSALDHDGEGNAEQIINEARTERALRVVRLKHPEHAAGVRFVVGPYQSLAVPNARAILVSTDVVWPKELDDLLRNTFSLSKTELTVVRLLLEGKSSREIAETRSRSWETIRKQINTILKKTGVSQQNDLLRLVVKLSESLTVIEAPGKPDQSARDVSKTLPTADGRVIEYIESGAGSDAVIYFHDNIFGYRLPDAVVDAVEQRGRRHVVPFRPYYGQTSPPVAGMTCCEGACDDLDYLLRDRRIGTAIFLCYDCGLFSAIEFARQHPGRVTEIIAVSASLPLWRDPDVFARMNRWSRLILKSAVHAAPYLPFLVRAGFALERKIGSKLFMQALLGDVPVDAALGDDEETMTLLHNSSRMVMRQGHQAHLNDALDSGKDWEDLLASCPVPITLVHGTLDSTWPVELARGFAERYPQISLIEVPDGGQMLPYSHPDLLAGILTGRL